jgi:hypothetical protein
MLVLFTMTVIQEEEYMHFSFVVFVGIEDGLEEEW